MASNLLGLVLFLTGCLFILANYAVAFKKLENRRRGIHKHISSIALLPQVMMLLSALSFNAAPRPWLDIWIPLYVSASDPSLWMLLFQTFKVVRNRPGKHRE